MLVTDCTLCFRVHCAAPADGLHASNWCFLMTTTSLPFFHKSARCQVYPQLHKKARALCQRAGTCFFLTFELLSLPLASQG